MACAVVGLMVLPGTAAGRLRRAPFCHGAGALTTDLHWQTSAPFLVSISAHVAANIARRAGYFEGRPVSAPRYVPCSVAEAVAFRGVQAWDNRRGRDGWIGASLAVATGRPYLGRFYCTGTSTSSGGAVETRTHRPNVHAGRIVVRFTIEPATIKPARP